MFVRIPRAGAPLKGLDWDGAVAGVKALQDEVTEQLWPRDLVTKKLIGKPDDSAPWLRFSVRQRPHRKAKPPRRLPPGWVPGPPDPPNKGTELVEIWIAPRGDCRCQVAEPLRDLIRAWGQKQKKDPRWEVPRVVLANLRQVEAWTERCGCGRSTLPVRWARGEL